MRTPLLILGSLFAAGCGLAETFPSARVSERSEIVGGVTDLGDPAVVALSIRQGGLFEQFCTGTLVSARTVLTAAHCIQPYGDQHSYFVTFGTSASQPSASVKVLGQFAHPQYDPASGEAHDFGVLQLTTPVTDVAPIEMNSIALTQAEVGHTIRHAGYGATSSAQSDSGTKRQATYTVRQVTAALIESGEQGKQTCNGDSGGPALMVMPGSGVEQLVGVVSFGDPACSQFGEDGRVDVDLEWIKQTMSPWETPSCATDGKCVPDCTPVDEDCACATDGVCSPDCSNLLLDPDCPRNCVQNGVCALEACPRPDPDCVSDGSGCGSAAVCKGRDIRLERATGEGSATPSGCAAVGFGDLSGLGALFGGLTLTRRRSTSDRSASKSSAAR